MTETAISRDTVAVEDAVHGIYKELTEGNDPATSPFRTMKDIFMWAVALGYKRGERRPLSGKRTTIFRWAQFTPQRDIPIIKALAIASTGDIEVLLNQDQILDIVEEYANAGIHDLRTGILEEHGQPLWNLIGLLKV